MSCLTASTSASASTSKFKSIRPTLSRIACRLCPPTAHLQFSTAPSRELPSPRNPYDDGRRLGGSQTAQRVREHSRSRSPRTASYPDPSNRSRPVRPPPDTPRSSNFSRERNQPSTHRYTSHSKLTRSAIPSSFPLTSDDATDIPSSKAQTRIGPWSPTKKLTYSAMAGLRTLHSLDPDKFTKPVLSAKFGISVEAVSRILRSKFRDKSSVGGGGGGGEGAGDEGGLLHNDEGRILYSQEGDIGLGKGVRFRSSGDSKTMTTDLRGTKWDRNPSTAESISPVPAIERAYSRRRPSSTNDRTQPDSESTEP
ncbi:hypothetical protein IAR55_006530 [Kwoniella newhampshirensis]|uniref:Required for respiratory growth protein 9, mitochondrial n=1 Tax=Kwoniella newhampshirensis TaxID=1651941 RepID=A0AAW0YU26_9TREE